MADNSIANQGSIPFYQRIPPFPTYRMGAFFLVLGIISLLLPVPQKNTFATAFILIGCLFFIPLKRLIAFVQPTSVNWPIIFLVPFLSVIFAIIHRLLALRGGIIVQVGILMAGVGVAILLTTNLFISNRNDESSFFKRLLPLSMSFLGLIILLISYEINALKWGVVLTFAIVLLPLVVYYSVQFGHYSFLAFTFLLVALWPALIYVPKLNWILGAWGALLIGLAVYRKIKEGLPVAISLNTIYALMILYSIWLIITFLFMPTPSKPVFLKVVLVFGQILFLFGTFENLRSKKDMYACLIGYGAGSAIVMLLMWQNFVLQITDFNLFRFLVFGFRATVTGEHPNLSVPPLLIMTLIAFVFFMLFRGKIKWLALIAIILGIFTIFLSGSRATQIGLFAALFVMSSIQPNTRRLVVIIMTGFVGLIVLAFLYNPQAMEILLRMKSEDSGRLLLWRTAWDMILDSPWLGYGPMSSIRIYPQIVSEFYIESRWFGGGAHNFVLSEMLETGFIGFFIYAMIYLAMWRFIHKLPNLPNSPWKLAATGIFIAFLVRGIFESNMMLFIHSTLGYCYPQILALVIAAGTILPDKEPNG